MRVNQDDKNIWTDVAVFQTNIMLLDSGFCDLGAIKGWSYIQLLKTLLIHHANFVPAATH